MRLENVKILKMGSRLGIALSEFYFKKGSIVENFEKLTDKFRSPHLWEKVNGEWKLKYRVS